jgi:hypothetical protein
MIKIEGGRGMNGIITCDNCKRIIAHIGGEYDESLTSLSARVYDTARPYKGRNLNDHYCQSCKHNQEREYDNFVDPLHFYH